MAPSPPHPVTLQAPATLGNFGPGFDISSLALSGLGDQVTLAPDDEDRVEVEGPGSDEVPTAWAENVVGPTLDRLRRQAGIEQPLAVRLVKPRRPGSGLGSSASSAAGAAVALHGLFPDAGWSPEDLVRAAGLAEGGAGRPHFDDVAAVVLGGLTLVRQRPDGLRLERVPPPEGLHIGLVVPDLSLPTREMRDLLPRSVPLEDAVVNLGNVARLVHAFHQGDVAAIGACLEDRLATPHRRTRIPFYEDARAAALEAGAHGAALGGSGPSLFAVCQDRATAAAVARAMVDAVTAYGLDAEAVTAEPEREVPYDVATMR